MRVLKRHDLFTCNYKQLNRRSLSCSQVVPITIAVWISNMFKSDENDDVLCKSRKGCLFICHVVKQCRSLSENIVIKPHLEPLNLQGELISCSIDFCFVGC